MQFHFLGVPNEIAKLEQLEKVGGQILIRNNDGMKELHFLKNIKQINTLGRKGVFF